jgi:hypothetical protein
MSRLRIILPLLSIVSLLLPAASGCARGNDFNSQVDAITAPYSFHLVRWEIGALGGMIAGFFDRDASDNTDVIFTYFDNMERIQGLNVQIDRATIGDGGTSSLEDEVSSLEESTSDLSREVVDQLKVEIKAVLEQTGIDNPFDRPINTSLIFPPIEAVLASSPNLLVVSPRNRIETIKEVTLLPEMSREAMEDIEDRVDALGYSALVVPLGGMATYPSYVSNGGGLQFTIDSIVHEWLHLYLAFTPLGFRYILDWAGIRPDYDIATMNETVVSMVANEIGAKVYETYFPAVPTDNATAAPPASGFDFNKVMRDTRTNVDHYLAVGEVDQAERYMEQQRQYLAANGYHIRKLNQAYFAFYGTYADSPTSVSPIGADLKTLRGQSPSLKAFLDAVSNMTSPKELEDKILNSKP